MGKVRDLCVLLVFVSSLTASAAGAENSSNECRTAKTSKYYTTKFYCNSQGQLRREDRLFNSTGTPSVRSFFENNKIFRRQVFNSDFEQTKEEDFVYNKDATFFKIEYSLKPFRESVVNKALYAGAPGESAVRLSKWFISRNKETEELEIKSVDHYGHFPKERIVSRDVFEGGTFKAEYVYSYPEDPTVFNFIDEFKSFDEKGVSLKSYNYQQGIDVVRLLEKQNVKDFSERLKILNDSLRRKVAVIDTGFDVNHPALTHKFYQNPNDPIDGIDNDQNGVVDDLVGWSVNDKGEVSANINERPAVHENSKPLFPFSHGTHVSTIALKDLDSFSLMGFSGNMSDVDHLKKVSQHFKKHNVEFSNMSFSFGDQKSPFSPNRSSFRALSDLISNNPEVLFSVAAGNSAKDLDSKKPFSKEYPANFGFRNIMSVGALDTGLLVESDMPKYRTAYFSSKGVYSKLAHLIVVRDSKPHICFFKRTGLLKPDVFQGLDT